MKVLVLGGSGFLGSHLVDELCSAGCDVVSLDRCPERFREQSSQVEFVRGEFGRRLEVEQILQRGIDVVAHLVSTTIPQSSNNDPIFDVQSNVIESIALFEMCVKYKIKKILFVSSGGTVYGVPKQVPVSESHSALPICSYGITKLTIEHYLHLFHQLYGLKYNILRLANPYGTRQDPRGNQGAISVFMYKLLTGHEITVWGDGSVVRDYIHATDFARACLAVIHSDSVGVYNVGSGTGTSINQILSVLEDVTAQQAKVNYLKGRNFDVPALYLDCSRLQHEFGWRPQVSLRSGMAETHLWMQELIDSGRL